MNLDTLGDDAAAQLRRFAMLADLEPQLWELWWLCTSPVDGDADRFCARDFWNHTIKPRLAALLGPQRPTGPEALRDHGAFQAAMAALFEVALRRPCRGCACPSA